MSKSKKTSDISLTKRVILLAAPYRSVFIACTLIAVILIPLNILRPYIIEKIVDDHLSIGDAAGMRDLVLVFVAVLFINAIFRYFFIYYTNFLGQSIVRDLRKRVFEKIISFRLSYFDKTPIGQSTTRTISDIEAINKIFTDGLITIISESTMIVAVLVFLFFTSWILALICLVLLKICITNVPIKENKLINTMSHI